jgi:hypothetical protein
MDRASQRNRTQKEELALGISAFGRRACLRCVTTTILSDFFCSIDAQGDLALMTREERLRQKNRERQRRFRERHPDYHRLRARITRGNNRLISTSPPTTTLTSESQTADEQFLRDWEEAIRWERHNRRTQANHFHRAKSKNTYWERVNYITLWQERGERCHECRQRVEYLETHWHHDVELSRGGYTVRDNLFPCHKKCHAQHTRWQNYSNKWLDSMGESLPDWWPAPRVNSVTI